MGIDQLTLPLSDEDLMRLAEHRLAQADRDDATEEDFSQMLDIFPAILQRLKDRTDAPCAGTALTAFADPELDQFCY